MGLELNNCQATIKGTKTCGKLHVDSNALEFRGDGVRWSVKVGSGTTAQIADGQLTVRRGSKVASFLIGDKAGKWQDKILHPPTRMTKLAAKPGMKFLLRGDFDDRFVDELAGAGLVATRMPSKCEIAFVLLLAPADLKRFAKAIDSVAVGTHVWAVWPKGKELIQQGQVIGCAREKGLGPGKGIAFDETHSAMRFTKK